MQSFNSFSGQFTFQGGSEKAADKGKKGDKGKDRGKSPTKGKGGKKTPEPSSPKAGTKLRRRGEEDTDGKYIGKFYTSMNNNTDESQY